MRLDADRANARPAAMDEGMDRTGRGRIGGRRCSLRPPRWRFHGSLRSTCNKAEASWASNPSDAFDRLDQARKLNFLSARPDLVQGSIAARLGEDRRVRSSFEQALERDPHNWYAEIELAALDGVEGHKQSALARLDRVAALNPREPLTATVRQGVISGKPVTLDQLETDFLARYCRVLGREAGPNGCQTG